MKRMFAHLLAAGLAAGCTLAHADSALLRSIDIESRAAVSTSDVYTRISPYLNQEVNHELLQDVLDEITSYYREQGYPTSRAYLPLQTSDDGTLRVEVLTSNISSVQINEGAGLRRGARERLLSRVRDLRGEPINTFQLEGSLLRLTDLGSFDITGEFRPTADSGELDFIVNTARKRRFDLALFADNHGTEAAGEYRAGFYTALRNVSGNADNLTFFAAASNEQQYDFSLGYDIPLNGYPTVLGAALCYNTYDLAQEYALLGATGQALSFDVYLRHTLLRSRTDKLLLSVGGYYKQLKDSFETFGVDFRKHETALYAGLGYSYDDQCYYLNVQTKGTAGQLVNDDDWDVFEEGTYLIYNQELSGGYYFRPQWLALATLRLQAANMELSGTERMTLSGADAVAAYDSSVLNADSGVLTQLAVQYQHKGNTALRVRPHLDYGYGKSHGSASERLAGVGIDGQISHSGFFAKIQLNHALRDPAGIQTDSLKAFLSIGYQNV